MTEKGRKQRHVAAAVSVSAAVGVFAVLGSTGLAQTALAPAQEVAAQNQPVEQNRPAEKVEICHKGRNTISISVNALPAHLAHGDANGACAVAAGTAETAKVKKAKLPKTDATESTEPSATETAERPTKPKPVKAAFGKGHENGKPAWDKSKKRTGLGRSSETSVGGKVKKAKKPTASEQGFVSPPGLGGGSPPGHANGHGNGKNK